MTLTSPLSEARSRVKNCPQMAEFGSPGRYKYEVHTSSIIFLVNNTNSVHRSFHSTYPTQLVLIGTCQVRTAVSFFSRTVFISRMRTPYDY